jgi:hypothetical protein
MLASRLKSKATGDIGRRCWCNALAFMTLWPFCSTMFTLSSWSKFNLPQTDFGGKTESFEGFTRLNRQYGNVGSVWLEDGGARINWWMSKKMWNKDVWKTMSEGISHKMVQ